MSVAVTFVMWLGVTPYLPEEAVFKTLGALAQLPRWGGGRVRLRQPAAQHRGRERARHHHAMAAHVAASGEPFRCYFETAALHERARALGFVDIEDLDRAALVERYLPHLPAKPRPGPGGHVVRMATR